MSTRTKVFSQIGAFAATNAAETFLELHGFSVGQMQQNAPRGIRFGSCDINKWRNLSKADIQAMHGAVTGNPRLGPVTIELFDAAPAEAVKAFSAELTPAPAELCA